MKIGDAVTYVDEYSRERPALVTTVGNDRPDTWVNLLFVSDDPARQDDYGRQIERRSSVSHQSSQQAPGNYWK